jgi:hypothetical protein
MVRERRLLVNWLISKFHKTHNCDKKSFVELSNNMRFSKYDFRCVRLEGPIEKNFSVFWQICSAGCENVINIAISRHRRETTDRNNLTNDHRLRFETLLTLSNQKSFGRLSIFFRWKTGFEDFCARNIGFELKKRDLSNPPHVVPNFSNPYERCPEPLQPWSF